jgi:membrane associated rhomboid family serine protease
MTPTPVGMRCPDCAGQRTQVRTMRNMTVEPLATYVLIGLCVLIYIGASTNASTADWLALTQSGIADGKYWELVTSGFMHSTQTILHILFNMYALFWLGRMIEPALGHVRFLAIYFASLLCGSFGVLLMPGDPTAVGASGAIFGLFGASIVMARNRNINLMASGLLPVLILNLVISFLPGWHIAWGAHVGGLIGGIICTFVIEELAKRRRASVASSVAVCAVLGVVAVAGSLAVS